MSARDEDAPVLSTCTVCEATIEHYEGTGWVDVVSGDEGGTYDVCPDAQELDAPHVPSNVRRYV